MCWSAVQKVTWTETIYTSPVDEAAQVSSHIGCCLHGAFAPREVSVASWRPWAAALPTIKTHLMVCSQRGRTLEHINLLRSWFKSTPTPKIQTMVMGKVLLWKLWSTNYSVTRSWLHTGNGRHLLDRRTTLTGGQGQSLWSSLSSGSITGNCRFCPWPFCYPALALPSPSSAQAGLEDRL